MRRKAKTTANISGDQFRELADAVKSTLEGKRFKNPELAEQVSHLLELANK